LTFVFTEIVYADNNALNHSLLPIAYSAYCLFFSIEPGFEEEFELLSALEGNALNKS